MSREREQDAVPETVPVAERAGVALGGPGAVEHILALQRSAGNRAATAWLGRQTATPGTVASTTDSRLGYRPAGEADTKGLGKERLPYTNPKEPLDGWNATEILNKLTQHDEDTYTFSDEVRCAANAALGIAIVAGPLQTIAFAKRVSERAWGRVTIKVDEHKELTKEAQAKLDRSMDNMGAAALAEFASTNIGYGWGTYKDLDEIAHATKVAMSANSHGFSTGLEAIDMARGAGATTPIMKQVASRAAFEKQLATLKPGDAFLINVDTDVLAKGTKPAIGQGNHFVTVGRLPGGGDGEYYLYDPYPRTGDQFVMSTNTAFWTLFENTDGEWKWSYIESVTKAPVKPKKK